MSTIEAFPPTPAAPVAQRSRHRRSLRNLSLQAKIGATILAILVLAAILAPLIAPYGQNELDFNNILSGPSASHFFGTDSAGRDVFSRTLYALRIDLAIVVAVTYIPLPIGVLVGAVAGYFGGVVDAIISRIADTMIAFPFMVLVIAVIAIVGPGLLGVYIGITVVGWALYARLTRAEVLVIKEQQFVLAAKSLGYSGPRIVFRHILPNVIRPNLVFSTLDIVLNILVLTSLSFLGLGVQPPTAEWGLMVSDGQTFLLTAWWISTLPGLMIVLSGVGFSLLGDGLADRLGQGRRGRAGENEGMILAVAEETP
jgi:peptide/nickel transport system permease protein